MTKAELKILKKIHRVAQMETATFKDRIVEPDSVFPITNPSETVQEVTRIWRQSWILDPLEEVIKKYDPSFNPNEEIPL